VFTVSPKKADPVPGPQPAPELARYDQIHTERDGVPAPLPHLASPGTALGVLAAVLDHDGQQLSATQTRQQALADADHLPWAVAALGPVPGHPLDRLDWQKKAAAIGAWRELSGYDHPTEAIGPEPATGTPDVRSVWFEALAAPGPVDGPDVRGMPDGRLLHLRDTYPIETAWAPQYIGDFQGTWSANYAVLEFMQGTGLTRFAPVEPQHWGGGLFRAPHQPSRACPVPTSTTSRSPA